MREYHVHLYKPRTDLKICSYLLCWCISSSWCVRLSVGMEERARACISFIIRCLNFIFMLIERGFSREVLSILPLLCMFPSLFPHVCVCVSARALCHIVVVGLLLSPFILCSFCLARNYLCTFRDRAHAQLSLTMRINLWLGYNFVKYAIFLHFFFNCILRSSISGLALLVATGNKCSSKNNQQICQQFTQFHVSMFISSLLFFFKWHSFGINATFAIEWIAITFFVYYYFHLKFNYHFYFFTLFLIW